MNNNYNNGILTLNKKINKLQEKINNSSDSLQKINNKQNNKQNNKESNNVNNVNNVNKVIIENKKINYLDILKKRWIDLTIILYFLILISYFIYNYMTSETVSYNDSVVN